MSQSPLRWYSMAEINMVFQLVICAKCNVPLFTLPNFNMHLTLSTWKVPFQFLICSKCIVTFFTMNTFGVFNVFHICVIIHFCFNISFEVTIITLIKASMSFFRNFFNRVTHIVYFFLILCFILLCCLGPFSVVLEYLHWSHLNDIWIDSLAVCSVSFSMKTLAGFSAYFWPLIGSLGLSTSSFFLLSSVCLDDAQMRGIFFFQEKENKNRD